MIKNNPFVGLAIAQTKLVVITQSVMSGGKTKMGHLKSDWEDVLPDAQCSIHSSLCTATSERMFNYILTSHQNTFIMG